MSTFFNPDTMSAVGEEIARNPDAPKHIVRKPRLATTQLIAAMAAAANVQRGGVSRRPDGLPSTPEMYAERKSYRERLSAIRVPRAESKRERKNARRLAVLGVRGAATRAPETETVNENLDSRASTESGE